MKKKMIAGILTIFLLITSCQTNNNAAIVNLSSPTLTPSPLATTVTRQPSKTATFSPPTEAVNFQATLTQQADDLLQAEMDTFPSVCENVRQRILSPEHDTLVISCGLNSDQTLEIISKTGIKWDLKFIDFLSEDLITAFNNEFEGERYLEGELIPLEWSKDGKYLYFGSVLYFDIDGPCFFGIGIHGLYRINVVTGNITTILYPSDSLYEGYKFAFSPDGKWLAFGKDQPYILDLQTWKNYPLEDAGYTYNFTWSADSSELAYVFDYSKMKVFRVDSMVSQTLVDEEGMCLAFSPNYDPLSIAVINGDDWVILNRYYLYDWPSGEITQLTPTPTQ